MAELAGMGDLGTRATAAVLAPLRHAEKYWALGVPPPSGLLLYGASGNGKTMLALSLAREAKEHGLANFIAVRCSELVSKVVGESERAVAEVFHRARKMSPCLIFLDQIEAIARRRQGADDLATTSEHTWDRLLSCLLTELDGIGSKSPQHPHGPGSGGGEGGGRPLSEQAIIVVGATVDMGRLDPALIRSGRLRRRAPRRPPLSPPPLRTTRRGTRESRLRCRRDLTCKDRIAA